MTLHDLLFDLLNRKPEARKTDSIHLVFEYVMRQYGVITPDWQWDRQKYIDMPPIQAISRELQRVKAENGWQDEKAKRQSKKYKKQYGQKTY